MEGDAAAQYEAKSQALRLELKQWENDWVKTHDGKKPSRADIKANEEIGTSSGQTKAGLFLAIVEILLTIYQHGSTSSTRNTEISLTARYHLRSQRMGQRSGSPCLHRP